MNEGFIENELIIITKQTFDRLLALENGTDAVALYLAYYSIAKWQGTNQIYSTTSFTARKLNWAENKVRRVKKELAALGLVEDIIKRDKGGKVAGRYIKVNYIFTAEHTCEVIKNHTMDEPQYGSTHSMAEQEVNALRNNNINALSDNNLNALRNKKEILSMYHDEFEALWKTYPRKIGKEAAQKSYIKARNSGVSREDIEQGITRYSQYIKDNKVKPEYIKHGSTWFNQHCWEDDYGNAPEEPTNPDWEKYHIVCEAIE